MSFNTLQELLAWLIERCGDQYPSWGGVDQVVVRGSAAIVFTFLLDYGPLSATVAGDWQDEALDQMVCEVVTALILQIALKRMRRSRDDVPKSAGRGAS